MLTEQSKVMAVRLAAPYLSNPTLNSAVQRSTEAQEHYFTSEFHLLNKTIGKVNALIEEGQTEKGLGLKAVYSTEYPISHLPALFSWKNKSQRNEWNEVLKQTFTTFNEEIRDAEHPKRTYTDPDTIGEPKDVFRFFLWDGYARWKAKMMVKEGIIPASEELNASFSVINALCEAAIVLAKDGDINMVEMMHWFQTQEWVSKKWGFDEKAVNDFLGLVGLLSLS